MRQFSSGFHKKPSVFKMKRVLVVFLFFKVVTSEENFHEGSKCQAIFNSTQFLITSPNYPEEYPNNYSCHYEIVGPKCTQNYHFQFLDFNIENSLNCSRDRFEIEGAQVICGFRNGIKIFNASKGSLSLHFSTDQEVTKRGFKILVTRLPCPGENEVQKLTSSQKQDIPNNHWPEEGGILTTPRPVWINPNPNNNNFCCAPSYKEKHFFLTSPKFPRSSGQTECVYNIFRNNPNVCRLRIHFLYFWTGVQDDFGCQNGYLQIDGKYFCGCRIGMKLISAFDEKWGQNAKTLRFQNSGQDQDANRGFVIEIFQDECAKQTMMPEKEPGNCEQQVSAPFLADVKKGRLYTSYIDRPTPDSFRHVYVFDYPEYFETGGYPRDVEKTDYTDTSSLGFVLPDGYDNYKCRNLGMLQWGLLSKQVLWGQVPKCEGNGGGNCQEFNYVRGFIQSSNYPYFYPPNLNLCYRIVKQPGYCGIKLTFEDFDLEQSFDCRKDYLSLGNGFRYCGRRLSQTTWNLDLVNEPFKDITFVSDSFRCGRGFKGVYEQVPCFDINVPYYPTGPTTESPNLTPIPNSQLPCDVRISKEYFTIEITDRHQSTCNILLEKYTPEACQLEMSLVEFDLACEIGYWLINNERYCDGLSGRTVMIPFNSNPMTMTFQRSDLDVDSSKFVLYVRGRQVSDMCHPYVYPQVPAERLLNKNIRLNNSTNRYNS